MLIERLIFMTVAFVVVDVLLVSVLLVALAFRINRKTTELLNILRELRELFPQKTPRFLNGQTWKRKTYYH